MAGEVADAQENVRLLHADTLSDKIAGDGHAVAAMGPLEGDGGKRLAVDKHAVAIEDDQGVTVHAGISSGRS